MKRSKVLSMVLALVLMLVPVSAIPAQAEHTVIVSLKYDRVDHFSEGMAAVRLNGDWGFIDKTGKEVVAPIYGFFLNFG